MALLIESSYTLQRLDDVDCRNNPLVGAINALVYDFLL